jgi:hypothetical protein
MKHNRDRLFLLVLLAHAPVTFVIGMVMSADKGWFHVFSESVAPAIAALVGYALFRQTRVFRACDGGAAHPVLGRDHPSWRQSASTADVGRGAQRMSTDVEHMRGRIDALVETASGLEDLVGGFKLADANDEEPVRLLRAAASSASHGRQTTQHCL